MKINIIQPTFRDKPKQSSLEESHNILKFRYQLKWGEGRGTNTTWKK